MKNNLFKLIALIIIIFGLGLIIYGNYNNFAIKHSLMGITYFDALNISSTTIVIGLIYSIINKIFN